MKRFDVVFRCDAGPGIGGGHLGRCLTLAHTLAEEGMSVCFAVSGGTPAEAYAAATSDFTVITLQGNAEHEADEIADTVGAAALMVVDHYGREVAFERGCQKFAKRILVIDDLPTRPHDCDILISPLGGSSESEWREVAGRARMMVGPDYALIRGDVVAMRPRAMSRSRDDVRRILISFGLSDSHNATWTVLQCVRRALPSCGIVATTSAYARHRSQLLGAAEALPGVTVTVDPPDYPTLLVESDLAVGAGGVSAQERACVGLPSVVIETAGNQGPGTRLLAQRGALVTLGSLSAFDGIELQNALIGLSDDNVRRTAMSRAASQTIDGRGAARIASQVLADIDLVRVQ